jgi:hypothetical protein
MRANCLSTCALPLRPWPAAYRHPFKLPKSSLVLLDRFFMGPLPS